MASTSSSAPDSAPLGKYLASTGKRAMQYGGVDLLTDLKTRKRETKLSGTCPHFCPIRPAPLSLGMTWINYGRESSTVSAHSSSYLQLLMVFPGFWMSDKPLVQQALADELASLLLTIDSTPVSLNFLRGFWRTTVREWNGIDRLR